MGKQVRRALRATALAFTLGTVFAVSYFNLTTREPTASSAVTYNEVDVGNGCLSIQRTICETIVDVSCRTRMHPEAYFHRIVDCLIPEYQFLKQSMIEATTGNSYCLVGQQSRYEYFKAINVDMTLSTRHIAMPHANRVKCFDRVEDQAVLQPSLPHSYSMTNLLKDDLLAKALHRNTHALMSDVRKSFPLNSTQKTEVLLVNRRGTRSFEAESEKALIDYIKGLHENFVVSVYSGLENATRTIDMFYSARVVIMFHGAAAANVVFCEDNTTVLEISCYADLVGSKKWRSNARLLRSLKPNITYGMFYIPLQVAFPYLNSTAMNATANRDKFIKGQRNVHLGPSELETVGNFIKESLFDYNSTRPSSVVEIE